MGGSEDMDNRGGGEREGGRGGCWIQEGIEGEHGWLAEGRGETTVGQGVDKWFSIFFFF